MSTSKRTQQISIDQLESGMFVVQLDIPWIDSPFLKHTRLIRSGDDVVKLRGAGVREVVIDLEKGKGLGGSDGREPQKQSATDGVEPRLADKIKIKAEGPGFIPLQKEINRAYQLRSHVKSTINKLNASLERNLDVDCNELMPLIEDTIRSLESNNQALLNLVHLSRKSQKLVDHVFSTFCLSLNLGASLDLDSIDMHDLGMAALLHDSGWLQLPLNLMGKRTPYTSTEKSLVRSHVDIGLRILSSSNLPPNSLRIIGEHQELCDGSGFPKGLKEEALFPSSKIFSVVDRYDECVHQLSDKPGMLPNNALRILYKEAEIGRYDPDIVASLIQILGIYPVSTAVRLNTGEKAVVEQVYEEAHMEPVVRIHYDANERALSEPLVINLHSKEDNSLGRKIREVLDPKNPDHDPENKLLPFFE